MKTHRRLLLAGFLPLLILTPACATTPVQAAASARIQPAAGTSAPTSKQMEYDLQHLSWKQFRSVVEAIPTLRAGIEAYGPAGWQFVQANYTRYGWQRNIDKLDDSQKKQLGELIRKAKTGR